ncbi:serine/threonine-protein kinase [Stackebrandtia soli]|uniref:serine/threonine-protein kinase n=1 Tax=Stackebrandtia soli TaxID=1892856 RepID=UPI0039EC9F80
MVAQRLLGGRYRLQKRLEDGGMGSVWHGWDERLRRNVAVKILHPSLAHDEVCRHRFRSEARAMAAMRHRGIAGIFDYGEETDAEGRYVSYLIMELVRGRPLSDLLTERGRLDATTVVAIVADTAAALNVAHRAGIIHRDVKPSNILVDEKTNTPKIIDFGIARSGAGMGLTSTGMVMGTASYVSPEQLRGGDPSASSDVYSLGVVAYECLAGRRPFHDDNTWRVIEGHLNTPPPPLPEDVPAAVAETVMRALAKTPQDRWSDAAELATACRELLDPRAAAESARREHDRPNRSAAPGDPGAPVPPQSRHVGQRRRPSTLIPFRRVAIAGE